MIETVNFDNRQYVYEMICGLLSHFLFMVLASEACYGEYKFNQQRSAWQRYLEPIIATEMELKRGQQKVEGK